MFDNPTQLLASMIRINSVGFTNSGRRQAERELAEHMEQVAASLGFATARLPVSDRGFNLLMTFPTTSDAPWLLFERSKRSGIKIINCSKRITKTVWLLGRPQEPESGRAPSTICSRA